MAQATRQVGPAPTHQDSQCTQPGQPESPADGWIDNDQECPSMSLRPVCDPEKVGRRLEKQELTAGFLARVH